MDFLQQATCNLNKRALALCFIHTSIAVMYGYGLYGYYDLTCRLSTGAPEEYAGFWKFLTYWNLISQFLFFAHSSFIDIFISERDDSNIVLRIRDCAYAGIVFPYAAFVSIMFWGIYISDRDKIFRKEDEETFPAWLNHVSHTVLLPVVLLEAFIVHHRYPSKLGGYALTLSFGAAYLLWVLYLGIAKDIWVYIFLKDFTYLGRGIFFLVSFAIAFVIYFVGEKINYAFEVLRRGLGYIAEERVNELEMNAVN